MPSKRRHNRTRRAKGRFRALYQLLAVLIVVGVAAAGCIVFFRVETIAIVGNQRYTAAEVIAASEINQGDYLMTLNVNRIVNHLRSVLPYVERVSVGRSLPDTVVITIQESAVTAAVQSEGNWWLINSSGKMLEMVPDSSGHAVILGLEPVSPAEGLPAVLPEEDANRWDYAMKFLQALLDHGMIDQLVSLDCSSAGTFTAQYGDRFTMIFPSTGNFNIYLSMYEGAVAKMEEDSENERGVFDFTNYESTHQITFRHQE